MKFNRKLPFPILRPEDPLALTWILSFVSSFSNPFSSPGFPGAVHLLFLDNHSVERVTHSLPRSLRLLRQLLSSPCSLPFLNLFRLHHTYQSCNGRADVSLRHQTHNLLCRPLQLSRAKIPFSHTHEELPLLSFATAAAPHPRLRGKKTP
ncbi:hypothetical protein LZ32DRAFT_188480 [Colletotrichum eremochloae]|nr:hypothetical protein LZ32DRAFT_188480 [Colletotrichum eremochloae]